MFIARKWAFGSTKEFLRILIFFRASNDFAAEGRCGQNAAKHRHTELHGERWSFWHISLHITGVAVAASEYLCFLEQTLFSSIQSKSKWTKHQLNEQEQFEIRIGLVVSFLQLRQTFARKSVWSQRLTQRNTLPFCTGKQPRNWSGSFLRVFLRDFFLCFFFASCSFSSPNERSASHHKADVTLNGKTVVSLCTEDLAVNYSVLFQVDKSKADRDPFVSFNNLEAGTTYTVGAVTVSGSQTSDAITIDITTGKCRHRSFCCHSFWSRASSLCCRDSNTTLALIGEFLAGFVGTVCRFSSEYTRSEFGPRHECYHGDNNSTTRRCWQLHNSLHQWHEMSWRRGNHFVGCLVRFVLVVFCALRWTQYSLPSFNSKTWIHNCTGLKTKWKMCAECWPLLYNSNRTHFVQPSKPLESIWTKLGQF